MARAKKKRKKAEPLRIAVLVSGTGSSLQNLIDHVRDRRLPGVEIAVAVSSRSTVEAVERAQRAEIPLEIIRVKDFPEIETFSDQIALTLDIYAVDLVVQAGWLCFWRPPRRWSGKVINIHPALLPRYGGKGFYGRRVHAAVLDAGDAETGTSVHWVDEEYDHGEIIAQDRCAVLPGDTVETLADRVRVLERELLPRVIAWIRDGRIKRPKITPK
ncbi:MAG: phosphoribosylglycinamide formyltransferase [Phycisphaerae bacterium]